MRHVQRRQEKFITELLEKFIISRPQGTSVRSIEAYHYTLDGFVDYPLTAHCFCLEHGDSFGDDNMSFSMPGAK